jgi:hypothetical protein
LNEHGQPIGEITNWEQIQFPFDPQLRGRADLAAEPVRRLLSSNGIMAREEYSCDVNGDLRVKVSAMPSGNTREYFIGQLTTS